MLKWVCFSNSDGYDFAARFWPFVLHRLHRGAHDFRVRLYGRKGRRRWSSRIHARCGRRNFICRFFVTCDSSKRSHETRVHVLLCACAVVRGEGSRNHYAPLHRYVNARPCVYIRVDVHNATGKQYWKYNYFSPMPTTDSVHLKNAYNII